MDVRLLRFCEAIARLGSFTRAAEEIHIAQPALSIAIAKLERELGVPLFFRHARGAAVTPEGALLLTRAARIFDEMDSMRREISDASDLRTGIIRVGLPPMYGLYYVPKLIMAFRGRHPGIEIVALQGSATQVREMLEDGRIDVGILEERRIDASLQSERIGADEMVLALAADHALAHNKTIEARALNKMPMVVLTDDFLQRQLLDAYCARHKVAYQKIMECNFVHLTVLAALEGQGAATLLRSLVTSQPGLAGLSFRPKISFNFDFCWRKDRYLSKAAHALVRFGRAMSSDGKA